jgi:hypothetical protein
MGPRGKRAEDLSGRRFGSLTVVSLAGTVKPYRGAKFPVGVSECLCDCGNIRNAWNRHLKQGRVTGCRYCSRERRRAQMIGRFVTRLPSGKTITEVAAAAGMCVDSVYHRWIRGWPESDLGLKRLPKGARRAPPPPNHEPESKP